MTELHSQVSLPSVAVVEDDRNLGLELQHMLEVGAPTIRFAGIARTAEQALKEFPEMNPDIVLMDVNLPGMGGVECVSKLCDLLPGVQIIMITVFNDTDIVFQALSAGAIGYLIKPVTQSQLLGAITEAIEGGAPMSGEIARKVVQTFRTPATQTQQAVEESLAPREFEILQFLAKGYLQKEIAIELGVSIYTIRTLTARIYKKLHVHSRSQAVAKYLGKIK